MKLLQALALFLALALLGGCASKARMEQRLTRVRPTQLKSEGEPLPGHGVAYDFFVDEKIRSLCVEIWFWDGERTVERAEFPVSGGEGRLLLVPRGGTFSVTLQQEGDARTEKFHTGMPDDGSIWRVEDCGIVPDEALSVFMAAQHWKNPDKSAAEETHYSPDYLMDHPELLAEYQWAYQVQAVFSENPAAAA